MPDVGVGFHVEKACDNQGGTTDTTSRDTFVAGVYHPGIACAFGYTAMSQAPLNYKESV